MRPVLVPTLLLAPEAGGPRWSDRALSVRSWGLGAVVVGALACGGLGGPEGSERARSFCEGGVHGGLCRTVPSSTRTFRIDETVVEILTLALFDASLEGTGVEPPPDALAFENGQGVVVVVAYTNTSATEARLGVRMGCVDVDGAESGSWPADVVHYTKGKPGWPDPLEPIVLPPGGTVKVPYVLRLTEETAVGGLLFFDGSPQPERRRPDGKEPAERVVLEITELARGVGTP